MSGKHTPGPWHVETWQIGEAKTDQVVVTTPAHVVAYVKGSFPPNPDELQADALLIAAAPDMREALSEIADLLKRHSAFKSGNDTLHYCAHKALTAIAKAKGQS
jgi:hypothetical protein